MHRRWFIVIVMALAGFGLAAGLLPWWLGVALRPVARARGLTFGRYERLGYARFRLTDVRFIAPGVQVTVARVEMDTPAVWIWRAARGAGSVIKAEDWGVQVHPAPPPGGEDRRERIDGAPALYVRLQRVASALARWIPVGQAQRGMVHWPEGELAVDQAEWRNGRLTVGGLHAAKLRFDGVVTPGDGWTVSLSAAGAAGTGRAELRWKGDGVQGVASILSQPVRLAAHFAARGWVPDQASAEASGWDVPADQVKLGAEYDRIRGEGRFRWERGAFEVTAQARAAPKSGGSAPPLELRADLHGDRREVTVAALHVQAPFAQMDLTAPVTFSYDGRLKSGPARLALRADLSRQPWADARGTVQGTVEMAEPAAETQRFTLECRDLHLPDFDVAQVRLDGEFRWPRLEIDHLELRPAAGDRLTARGAIDLHTLELTGVAVEAEIGAARVRRWLPKGWDWERARVAVALSGPLQAPRHEGSATLTRVRVPGGKPFDLVIGWRGAGAAASDVTVQATAGAATLHVAGSLDRRHASLRELTLASARKDSWKLAGLATIAWSPALRIEGLRLDGPDGGLLAAEIAGEGDRSFRLEAANVDSSAGDDWLVRRGPAWRLTRLQATGRIEAGRLAFAAQASALLSLAPQPATLRLNARSEGRGVRVDELTVMVGNHAVAHAAGRLPVGWQTATIPRLQFDADAPLQLEAGIEEDSPFWNSILDHWGIGLTAPAAHARIEGTLREPRGELDVSLGHLGRTGGPSQTMPLNLDDLTLRLRADRAAVTLDSLSAKIEGQTVRATARMAMGVDRWQRLVRRPEAFDWRKIEGRVEIPDADLAAVARQLPDFPLIQGKLRATVEQSGDGVLTGEAHLLGGVSRPVEPVGVVQEINGDLTMAEQTLTVRSFTATLGGERVTLGGTVAWPARGEPRFDLRLEGRNLPIVRRAGLLLRSDLDLRAETDAAGTTRLTGAFNLRDCLVLADLSELLPIGQRGVTRQPPYFAVTSRPFAGWQLAIEVRGSRSVRVRTPVFSGTASPRFQLAGTLGEPRAVGELTVEQGQVLFPFANFQVQVGAIRLSEADPYHPQLTLNAVSNRRDYRLRLEARGPPEAPTIAFSSNPPLDSAQVLLLVTTGQPPTNVGTGTTEQQRLARLGTYVGKGLVGGLAGGDEGRLELITGNQPSRQGRDTYEVDYRLGDRWSLVGEYDEFDDYNAGFKWRVYVDEGGPGGKK